MQWTDRIRQVKILLVVAAVVIAVLSLVVSHLLTRDLSDEERSKMEVWSEAMRALITGQAKSYKVGTREFTALDADDLMDLIVYFSNLVEALSGNVRTKRVTRIVPRDL